MKQEIKNLNDAIAEIKEGLSSGGLSEEDERKAEKALEAATQLRDAYQQAVNEAEKSPSP